MKIIIDDHYDIDFIYSIPQYIKLYLDKNLNVNKCERFKEEFNVDVKNAFNFAIATLVIRHIDNYYTIEIDKNKYYDNINISRLINLITYGNRSVRGYKILLNLFDFISNKTDMIYRRWKSGGY